MLFCLSCVSSSCAILLFHLSWSFWNWKKTAHNKMRHTTPEDCINTAALEIKKTKATYILLHASSMYLMINDPISIPPPVLQLVCAHIFLQCDLLSSPRVPSSLQLLFFDLLLCSLRFFTFPCTAFSELCYYLVFFVLPLRFLCPCSNFW